LQTNGCTLKVSTWDVRPWPLAEGCQLRKGQGMNVPPPVALSYIL